MHEVNELKLKPEKPQKQQNNITIFLNYLIKYHLIFHDWFANQPVIDAKKNSTKLPND